MPWSFACYTKIGTAAGGPLQLEAWVQVDGFQSFQMSDARVEVETRLDYQIKNAGVRSLNLQLPKVAMGVRILGEHVST